MRGCVGLGAVINVYNICVIVYYFSVLAYVKKTKWLVYKKGYNINLHWILMHTYYVHAYIYTNLCILVCVCILYVCTCI